MGQDTAGQAGRALRLLNSPELRHPRAAGPSQRRATSTTPAAPLNLGIVDYLTKQIGEVVDLTRQVNTAAGPAPENLEALYDWCVEQTGDADEAQRAYRELVFERQRLEHWVRLGGSGPVPGCPCPRCGCWGVMWEPGGTRARCTNRRCRTPDGMGSTWTLARLAAQKVQQTEIWRRNAT